MERYEEEVMRVKKN